MLEIQNLIILQPQKQKLNLFLQIMVMEKLKKNIIMLSIHQKIFLNIYESFRYL